MSAAGTARIDFTFCFQPDRIAGDDADAGVYSGKVDAVLSVLILTRSKRDTNPVTQLENRPAIDLLAQQK